MKSIRNFQEKRKENLGHRRFQTFSNAMKFRIEFFIFEFRHGRFNWNNRNVRHTFHVDFTLKISNLCFEISVDIIFDSTLKQNLDLSMFFFVVFYLTLKFAAFVFILTFFVENFFDLSRKLFNLLFFRFDIVV